MVKRTYGQYCGFARALEMVGERWALLIVRDLLVAPKRFSDLQRGLPGIPTNVLTARLKEMEGAGIVRRRVLPRPSSGVAYELTERGLELEPSIVALGRWGAKLLGAPSPGEVMTPDSLVMALRTTFQPKLAKHVDTSYEIRFGEIGVHARVKNGTLVAAAGSLPEAATVFEAGTAFKELLSGEATVRDAIKHGGMRVLRGSRASVEAFFDFFRIE